MFFESNIQEYDRYLNPTSAEDVSAFWSIQWDVKVDRGTPISLEVEFLENRFLLLILGAIS